LTVRFIQHFSLRRCAFLCAAALKKFEYLPLKLFQQILVFFQRSDAEKGAAAQRRKKNIIEDK